MARSWTDPFSNLTALAPGEIQAHLRELADEHKRPPISILPSLIHESTHHWCFASAVGSSIAMLHLRGRLAAYGARFVDQERAGLLLQAAMNDLGQCEFALGLLQPLSEGLALFAEFDVVPESASPVLSPPMEYALRYYSVGQRVKLVGSESESLKDTLRGIDAQVAVLMREVRPMAAVRRRKESVLMQPLANWEGGYLAGYLSVKALWRAARKKDERLADSDLFLVFLRTYMYADLGFVAVLLEEKPDFGDFYGRLYQAFKKRLAEILNDDLTGAVDALIESAGDGSVNGDHIRPPWLNPNAAQWQLGESRMLSLLDDMQNEIFRVAERDEWMQFLEDLKFTHSAIMQGRDLLHLATAPVSISIAEHSVRVTSGNEVIWSAERVDQADTSIEKAGTLEIYLSTAHRCRITATFANGDLLAIATYPKLADPELTTLINQLEMRRALDATEAHWKSYLDEVIDIHAAARDEAWSNERLPNALENIYITLAFLQVSDGNLDAVTQMLRPRGFWGLLNENSELVRGLALLGLCAATRMLRPQAEDTFASTGMDHEAVVAQLKQLGSQWEIPVVWDAGYAVGVSV